MRWGGNRDQASTSPSSGGWNSGNVDAPSAPRARRGEWTFSLRGSLDAERTFESAETALEVWGEDLRSESAKNRVLPGLSGVYRWGRFSLGGEVSAGGLGSDDREYSGLLHLGMRF